MKDNYDFSKGKKSPYADQPKLQATIGLDARTLEYFKVLADKRGIHYQTLINLFLSHCVENKIKPDIDWKERV